MRRCRILKLLLALFTVCFVSQKVEISALTDSDFGGETYGYSWSIVDGESMSKESKQMPLVTWEYSNRASHRQWFSIIEEGYSNGVGEAILQFKSESSIYTNSATVGKKYYLKSKREQFLGRAIYISGVWSPN